MPAVDGGIELHAGIAALVGGFGDLPHHVARLLAVFLFAGYHRAGPPLAIFDDGLHEFVRRAD
jgi:hypothetical protein